MKMTVLPIQRTTMFCRISSNRKLVPNPVSMHNSYRKIKNFLSLHRRREPQSWLRRICRSFSNFYPARTPTWIVMFNLKSILRVWVAKDPSVWFLGHLILQATLAMVEIQKCKSMLLMSRERNLSAKGFFINLHVMMKSMSSLVRKMLCLNS